MGIDLKKHGHKLFEMYKTFHQNKDAVGIGLFITKNQIESLVTKCLQYVFESDVSFVIELDELAPVGFCHRVQMADHPAIRLKFPFIGQTDEAVVAAHIGEEGKLAAA